MSRGLSSSDVKDVNLGPMQEAARALKGGEAKEEVHDGYEISVLFQNKYKRDAQEPIPLNLPLSMDVHCPEGLVDQFTWSKLQGIFCAYIIFL